jgi:hypothetical protein
LQRKNADELSKVYAKLKIAISGFFLDFDKMLK